MKKLAWLGMILLALIILMLGIAGVARGIFGNRYEAQIAILKAKGEPITPGELMGEPIPPSENAALVYEQAFNALDDPAVEAQWKLVSDFDMKTNDVPKWRKVERALVKLQPALALADQAALMPRCRFDIDWSDQAKVMSPVEISRMRSLSRLKYAHALVNARNGDMGAAVDDVETLFTMSQSLKDAPMFIHQLVRVAMCSFATKGIERILDHGDMTEEQALRLFVAAGKIDTAHGFRRAWQGERVFVMHFFGPGGFTRMATSAGTGSVPKPVVRGLASAYSHTLLAGDMAVTLGILGRQVDGVDLNFREAKSSGLFDKQDVPFYAHMSQTRETTLEHAARYSAEEQLARTQIFLALQAYEARYGAYPASMGELKSKLGWKMPVDPFSGKDFIYKRLAKGFVLYSIGPDMKDDGGRAVPDNNVMTLGDKGDIVLRWKK